jgi:hypothetical protein
MVREMDKSSNEVALNLAPGDYAMIDHVVRFATGVGLQRLAAERPGKARKVVRALDNAFALAATREVTTDPRAPTLMTGFGESFAAAVWAAVRTAAHDATPDMDTGELTVVVMESRLFPRFRDAVGLRGTMTIKAFFVIPAGA